jgi:hypothetical protein
MCLVLTVRVPVAERATLAAAVAALPPHAEAPFGVAWAGETRSANWLDTGREYTERWHHQMQIRDAVGAPPLLERRPDLGRVAAQAQVLVVAGQGQGIADHPRVAPHLFVEVPEPVRFRLADQLVQVAVEFGLGRIVVEQRVVHVEQEDDARILRVAIGARRRRPEPLVLRHLLPLVPGSRC